MLRGLAALLVACLGFVLAPSAQATTDPPVAKNFDAGGEGVTPPDPLVTATSEGKEVTATIETSGSTTSGVPFRHKSVKSVPPLCWYGQGPTGKEFNDQWGPDGTVSKQGGVRGDYRVQNNKQFPGFEIHETDTLGHWYEAKCRADAPEAKVAAYMAAHPPLWVNPTDPVPAVAADVEPDVLAELAFAAMDLPESTIQWNPKLQGSMTIVNMDTWVWMENATTTVQVTASVPSGTSVTVTATLDHMDLKAPGADDDKCADTGVPWTEATKSTSCSIVFYRSSANQPIKDGQTQPTATLTATSSWAASWSTNLAPGVTTALPTQQIPATAEIPVAEIQSIVTSSK